MAFFTVENVAIKGLSAAVPKDIISNRDNDLLSDKEKRLLIKTTGVEERRRASEGITTSDLCYEAAQQLLLDLNWKPEDIDLLVFVSQSQDYYLPATSIILQDRLGLSKSCMAFDVGLGCSGYVYGLSIISSLMNNSGLRRALLLAGDVSTATCSPLDKSTFPLFGDAGSVTALEYDEQAQEMVFSLHSDGAGSEAIMIPHGGIRNLVSPSSFEQKEIAPGIIRTDLQLALKGLDVFNFSIKEVPHTVKEFWMKTNTKSEDYDYFVMHQANKLMNETIRKKLKIESEKVPYSISKYGNTSSASIPLTLLSELENQLSNNSKRILMTGFGVGLSWGVASINIENICCSKICEV